MPGDPSTGLDEHSLERWMYRQNGMDYGPFSVHEMQGLIEAHKICGTTEVREVRQRRWLLLREVPHLNAYLEEFLKREAEERRRREVLLQADKVERALRRQRRWPLIFVGGGALVAGLVALLVVGTSRRTEAVINLNIFKDITLPPLPEVPKIEGSSEAATTTRIARRQVTKVKPPKKTEETQLSPEPIEAMDFTQEDEEAENRKPFSSEQQSQLQKRVLGGLIQCFKEEALQVSGFKGGSVFLFIMTSGKVRVTRIETSPPPSQALTTCVNSVVRGVQVEPFSGPNQILEIPLFVANIQ